MGLNIYDLDVWKKGRVFRNDVRIITKKLPDSEKYRLVDQLIRASRSITANVAEGHGRFHFQENIQYCRQARGSLVEVYDHLTVAIDENYIANEEYEKLFVQYEELMRMLNGYIAYLKKRKSEG